MTDTKPGMPEVRWNAYERLRGALIEWQAKAGHMEQRALAAERDAERLREALQALVDRIDHNGGIGEYRGGHAFVMRNAKAALSAREGK